MTNEEAIFELGYAKDFQTPKRKEAIDMAIEALENNDKLVEDLQNCLEMYKKKKAEVEVLKQNQWIPCEERLPEVEEDVLITYHFESDNEEYFPSHDGVKISYWTGVTNHKIPQFAEMGDRTVVNAWMPLPKPYEGRTE